MDQKNNHDIEIIMMFSIFVAYTRVEVHYEGVRYSTRSINFLKAFKKRHCMVLHVVYVRTVEYNIMMMLCRSKIVLRNDGPTITTYTTPF
jgi:hypothetical protein